MLGYKEATCLQNEHSWNESFKMDSGKTEKDWILHEEILLKIGIAVDEKIKESYLWWFDSKNWHIN